jgi:hypothetical protein
MTKRHRGRGKVHTVMAGNPTRPAGAFYDAFTRDRDSVERLSLLGLQAELVS